MRLARAFVVVAVFVVIGLVAAVAIERATGSSQTGYLVRAVFDNSSFVIPGEDVKIAGVKVGTIKSVALTAQNKAALVLAIDARAFVPFRTDAHCEIGIESLLGEQFVQCSPTQPRPPGSPAAAALPTITSGPGRGQHLLPVQDTNTPVGQDLLTNITRLPQQQRLQLIIAGLGAGLAANGQQLNAALLRADPALQQTDRVIGVLSSQNALLARLTGESDQILAPLAAQRAHIGGFIEHTAEVAVATARQGQALEQNLQSLPPFLRQLRPAATRLSNLALQLTPALQALAAHAPAINASLSGLGPLAKTAIPAVQTLGNVAQRGETVFPRVHDVADQLSRLGTPLVPLASDLGALSSSFDGAGGIEDVMRFIYYYTGTVNGEDSIGHYIRSLLEINNCARTSTQAGGCGATFATTTVTGGSARASRAAGAATGARAGAGHASAAPAEAGASTPVSGGQTAKALLDYLLSP
jgi:phospholipid/cholesterol/gamma-HCH transport system substrate-binding protein